MVLKSGPGREVLQVPLEDHQKWPAGAKVADKLCGQWRHFVLNICSSNIVQTCSHLKLHNLPFMKAAAGTSYMPVTVLFSAEIQAVQKW